MKEVQALKEGQLLKDLEKQIGKLYKQIPLNEYESKFPNKELLKKSKVMQILLTALVLDADRLESFKADLMESFKKNYPKFKTFVENARKQMFHPEMKEALIQLCQKYPAQMVRIENIDFDAAKESITANRLLSAQSVVGAMGISLRFATPKPGGGIFSYVAWDVPILMTEEVNPFRKLRVLEMDLVSGESDNLDVVQMVCMLYAQNIGRCAIHVRGDLKQFSQDATRVVFDNLPDQSIIAIYDQVSKSQDLISHLIPGFQTILFLNTQAFDLDSRAWYEAILKKSNQMTIMLEHDSFNGWLNRDKDCLLDMLSQKAEYILQLDEDNRWETQLCLIETLLIKGGTQVITLEVKNPNLKMLAAALNEKYPQYRYKLDAESSHLKIDLRTPTLALDAEPLIQMAV